MTSNENRKRSEHQPFVEKRVTTMPDGRYLIYFTFPAIDAEFDKLPAIASATKEEKADSRDVPASGKR